MTRNTDYWYVATTATVLVDKTKKNIMIPFCLLGELSLLD
jgi:hypothetical protein